MGAVLPLVYSLDTSERVRWTATQEKTISRRYPFILHGQDESAEQYVIRTYLQFLWLPESIMPLRLFVPSLLRVSSMPDSGSLPHLLHSLIEPLLHTPRSSSIKYHEELSRILDDGGGAGEIEEEMMWFVIGYAKRNNVVEEEDIWMNVEWRNAWLTRMERREVQIQILLHLVKLSISGPIPPLQSPNTSPRKRRRPEAVAAPSVRIEQRLESFMDKLSMWQLVLSLDNHNVAGENPKKEELDWMQLFCRDVVEPQFSTTLAPQCSLLRSKLFPHSPFSDISSPASSRSTSPAPHNGEADEDEPVRKRVRSSSTTVDDNAFASHEQELQRPRSRSRSLSVSLAQERLETKGPVKKKPLNREISMSRVFKAKKAEGDVATKSKPGPNLKKAKEKAAENRNGIVLVAATPVKSRTMTRDQVFPGSQMASGRLDFGAIRGGEEEIWDLPGSSDILPFDVVDEDDPFGGDRDSS